MRIDSRLTSLLAVLIGLLAGPFAHSSESLNRRQRDDADHAHRVSYLRNDHAAFALLIESFEQLQTSTIEADYQQRIFVADQIAELTKRRAALVWAGQERELRLAKLRVQIAQMEDGYRRSSRSYQQAVGIDPREQPDREAVHERLQEMVLFVPDTKPGRGRSR